MDYQISKINDDGSVTATFTSTQVAIPVDRKTQTITGISSKDQLDQYARDFLAGLKQEQAQATTPTDTTSDLTALVGKKQTVSSEPVEG